VQQFIRPVWRRFVTTEILSGRFEAPFFEMNPEPYLSANFITPRQDWVDPLKDSQADIMAINAGHMSRRQAVAARGYSLEALDAEIAADKQNAESLGLNFSQPAAAPSSLQPVGVQDNVAS
jgi:capsid protein